MSQNNSITSKLPNACIPEPRVTSSLNSKMDAIYKHEEIIWKVRAGYLTILYAGLTFFAGKANIKAFEALANSKPASLMILFLIIGFSLSAFLVDFAYLRKKIRIIVVRDMLIDAAYNPKCRLHEEDLYMLLQVGSERPLKNHFRAGQKKYRLKVNWNLVWILLPIYAVTPLLALTLGLLYRLH